MVNKNRNNGGLLKEYLVRIDIELYNRLRVEYGLVVGKGDLISFNKYLNKVMIDGLSVRSVRKGLK